MPGTCPLVHLIADYGAGDLAFAEVRQQLALHLPGVPVVPTPVPAFDTLSAGFCIGQLALTDGPAGRVVFHNVAPRAEQDDPRPDNAGEPLTAAWLADGTLVVGPNAGYAFSFVRDQAVAISEVAAPDAGSQFRSRDFFPAAIARLVAGERDAVGSAVPVDTIPAVPEAQVLYVDGYGNLKTSWVEPPAESGTSVTVTIGGTSRRATVGDGTFEVPQGELSFAPGSSGGRLADGTERRFFELLLRGGSAAAELGNPPAGSTVEVS